jgi:hypothetical protein
MRVAEFTRRSFLVKLTGSAATIYGYLALGRPQSAKADFDCHPDLPLTGGCVTHWGPPSCNQSVAAGYAPGDFVYCRFVCYSSQPCDCAEPCYVQASIQCCADGGCVGRCTPCMM